VRARVMRAVLGGIYLATAIPGTVLGLSGLALWAIADAAEIAAQPYLKNRGGQ